MKILWWGRFDPNYSRNGVIREVLRAKGCEIVDFHPRFSKTGDLVAFLRHIFDQPLDRAGRLGDYGYQVGIRRRARRMWKLYIATHPAMWGKTLKKRIKGI